MTAEKTPEVVFEPHFVTDCFFEQGKTHEVCEDYAICDVLKPFVVISDGCSNGGGPRIDSDWGARLLCKAAELHQQRLASGYSWQFSEEVFDTARQLLASLPNLQADCLTATLLTLLPRIRQPFLTTYIIGDGVYGGLKKNGDWVINSIEFQPGGTTGLAAPYYLKYMVSPADHYRYYRLFGLTMKVTTHIGRLGLNGSERQIETTEKIVTQDHSTSGPLQEEAPVITENFSLDEYRAVFIGSDGLSSFEKLIKTSTTKHTEPVPLLDVLEVLLDIPVFRPGFLRLQRQWAFKQAKKGTFQQRGWHNNDDVSMGMIYCAD